MALSWSELHGVEVNFLSDQKLRKEAKITIRVVPTHIININVYMLILIKNAEVSTKWSTGLATHSYVKNIRTGRPMGGL